MELRAGYKQTEIGVIPDDWEEVRLGEVGHALIGLTYKPTDIRKHGTLVLRSSNIQNGNLAFEDNVFVEESVAAKSLVEVGDLLICARNGSRELIGKSTQITERARGMAFGAFMAAYRSDYNDFLSFQFQSDLIKRQINEHLGATINQITNRSLLSFRAPLPNSQEERQVIAEALGDADGLIERLDALIAKKRDLKQGAMQQLLTGKTRLSGFSGKWKAKQLGDFATIRNQKVNTLGFSTAKFCIELEQIGQNTGEIDDFTDARDRTTSKYQFEKGDVLFGRLRPYLRKFWLATQGGVCSTEIWPLVAIEGEAVAAFLFQTVRTDAFIEAATAAYGTHMPRADWSVLKSLQIETPADLAEQSAIADVLSDMDTELAALETKRDKARAIKQGMMQELLTGRIRLV